LKRSKRTYLKQKRSKRTYSKGKRKESKLFPMKLQKHEIMELKHLINKESKRG